MKKLILSLFLMICAMQFVNTQWVYQQVPSNTSQYVTLEFPNSQIGTAGGGYVSTNFLGRAAYTTNAGSNWYMSQVPDSTRGIADIAFVNLTTGYCVGAYNKSKSGRILLSNNYDKRTFQIIKSSNVGIDDEYMGLFMKTTNSGQSWFTYGTLPSNVYYLGSIQFVNSITGFAIASYDHYAYINYGIIKTTNAGLNWTLLTMPESINDLERVYFTDINTGIAVGFDEVNDTGRAIILRTTNSGLTWNRQVFMEIYQFRGINFTNSYTGLAVGRTFSLIEPDGTRIYRTTNGGLNWTQIFSYDDLEIYGTRFVQGTGTALIYGYRFTPTFHWKEFIARTTNYGDSWTESVLSDTGLMIFDSELLDQSNWYLAGVDADTISSQAVILHTTNGGAIGIIPVGTEIPNSFSLHQNYPNPFNPTTKIKFDIPLSRGVDGGAGRGVLVKLIIYDLLGREVATLVNEPLKPGSYEFEFEGSSYASGVYFYSLITNEYAATKKLILLK